MSDEQSFIGGPLPNIGGTDGLIVSPQTTDEKTLEFVECEYAAQTLGTGGVPTKVLVGNGSGGYIPLQIYIEGGIESPVSPVDLQPAMPSVVCAPATRTMLPSVNKTVFIEGKLPLIGGDKCVITGGTQPRSLRSPFISDSIYIQTQVTPPTEE